LQQTVTKCLFGWVLTAIQDDTVINNFLQTFVASGYWDKKEMIRFWVWNVKGQSPSKHKQTAQVLTIWFWKPVRLMRLRHSWLLANEHSGFHIRFHCSEKSKF